MKQQPTDKFHPSVIETLSVEGLKELVREAMDFIDRPWPDMSAVETWTDEERAQMNAVHAAFNAVELATYRVAGMHKNRHTNL